MSRGIDEYLRAIIKGIPIILLAVVIGVLTGYVVCEIVLGPTFEAETSVTFYPAESGSGNPMVLQLTGADKEEEKARREECARIIGGEETAVSASGAQTLHLPAGANTLAFRYAGSGSATLSDFVDFAGTLLLFR